MKAKKASINIVITKTLLKQQAVNRPACVVAAILNWGAGHLTESDQLSACTSRHDHQVFLSLQSSCFIYIYMYNVIIALCMITCFIYIRVRVTSTVCTCSDMLSYFNKQYCETSSYGNISAWVEFSWLQMLRSFRCNVKGYVLIVLTKSVHYFMR